ncbi:MAG: hypothetical protein MRY74_10665 [Neomegalonema sp.]|nr:hypothetical protein [Neomegalonema sp.]
MKLIFEDRVVASVTTDAEGRPAAIEYDPRWLQTPGAFPIARALPLREGPFGGPAVAQWARMLSLEGAGAFEAPLADVVCAPLFGALTLSGAAQSTEDEGPAELALEREITEPAGDVGAEAEIGEGAIEKAAFVRSLAKLCDVAATPWRAEANDEIRRIWLRRADRARLGDDAAHRVVRLPLEIIAFGAAPVRSATIFKRLDGVLDAQARLALFDRLAFADALGVDAPATAVRLDGVPRLAPIGSDWTGVAANGRVRKERPEGFAAWAGFAQKAGLNKTFAPRRAAAVAAEMRQQGLEAVREAAEACAALRGPILEFHRRRLEERIDRMLAIGVG